MAKKRILHVVGGMSRAGAETWLMHVLRHIDRERFQMDFLVHTTQPCAYDDEICSLGSKVIPCLHPSQPLTYARSFKRILREYGPYDIVHSHVHHFSGYVLRIAKQAGVPVRIAHSHNDTSSLQAEAGWARRLYLALTQQWILCYATLGLGCSVEAAADLFGADWKADPRWRVLYCGIDLTPFQNFVDRLAVRAELGVPADAFVIGHIGRFVEQKNHVFLLDIAAEVAKREPRMYLLLVGDGSLRPEIEQKVDWLGLSDRVIFAGIRPDVPRLMLGAMDVFVLPSLHEGLPLVLMEAQAAGLPCIFSDVVSEEADIAKPLMQRVALSQPTSKWAKAVLSIRNTSLYLNHREALKLVEQSSFNVWTSIKNLEKLYLNCS